MLAGQTHAVVRTIGTGFPEGFHELLEIVLAANLAHVPG